MNSKHRRIIIIGLVHFFFVLGVGVGGGGGGGGGLGLGAASVLIEPVSAMDV